MEKLPVEKKYFLELRTIQDNSFYLNIYEQLTRKKRKGPGNPFRSGSE